MIPAPADLLAGSRQLRRTIAPAIVRAARTPGADRYRKHFPAAAHLWLLVLHGLSSSPSLRQSYAVFRAVPGLFARLGLSDGLSFSQLARSSTSRPPDCFEQLLADLIRQAQRTVVPDAAWRILRKVLVIDSTFLRLSVQLSGWSQPNRFAAGVRIQTGFDLAHHLPTTLSLTLNDRNDHQAMAAWDLEPLRGWTVVADLGYYGHRDFQRLREHDVSFLSRLHPQASCRVTDQRTVPVRPTPEGDVVLSDETIVLGSPNNRKGAVLPGIRLIRSRNRMGKEQVFVTDRMDVTAWELVRLYHFRWQIELFFRFLKRQLGLLTVLGRSRAAVWLTVLVIGIVAVLVALVEADRAPALSRIAWLRGVGQALLLEARVRSG